MRASTFLRKRSLLLTGTLLHDFKKREEIAAVAAVRPMCAEAELLSYIDMIDSRMEIYKENFESTPLGAFSERVFALDGKRIFHHK